MDVEAPVRRRWLEGEQAVRYARFLLSDPGMCAIDFETWPGNPKWHGDMAAARAPFRHKKAARDAAELWAVLEGRAHRRQACTLQLARSDGLSAFIRLTDPARELPAMFEPVTNPAPWEDPPTLVAHHAQFETEVLLKHGVAIDVECTLIAAKCLYLEAVPEDRPQPVRFGLADLVAREFGRVRDKTIRDRDWRSAENLDEEAVEYGLMDARDCLRLWRKYERRLRAEDLFDGYRVMQGALLPTADANVNGGLPLDRDAHRVLMAAMRESADEIAAMLNRECRGAIELHGSDQQVSNWIIEEVLELKAPIAAPAKPAVVGLKDFLRSRGGVRLDVGGELRSRDLPKSLVRIDGRMSLHDATIAAWEAGYIGEEHSRFDPDAGLPVEDDLLDALDRERFGELVLPVDDQARWAAYLQELEHWEHEHVADRKLLMAKLVMRLMARTGGLVKGWRSTPKTGNLVLSRGHSLRTAEQIAPAFPRVAEYLVKRARWRKAAKLWQAFGDTLLRFQDADGKVRGQLKTFAAWTGRQSCVNPNLQQQPHDDVFRALWRAAPGRTLVIADYSQIELRLLAIVAGDERLREVYREGRDVHQETADIAGIPRKDAKSVNFALAYGSGVAGLCENFGFTVEHGAHVLACVLGAYSGLATYRQRAPRDAERQGFIAIRPNRRVKYTADSPGTTAINAPIQGGAASVQMRALRLTWEVLRASGIDSRLAASVHDEIILDSAEECAAEAAELLVDCMTRALLEVYPEAEEMGLARLTAAAVCDRWSEKP